MRDVLRSILALGFAALLVAVLAAILFISAGRRDLPFFWAYIYIYALLILANMLLIDRGLLRERIRIGFRSKDFCLHAVKPLAWAHFIGAGLDVGRYHWSDSVPPVLQTVALIGIALAGAGAIWAISVNRFFLPDVRIQEHRGHHVVTDGPYRYVRHPGYVGVLVWILLSGVALGSWLSVVPGILFALMIVWRAAKEDQFLHENLDGYLEYAARVRYRLLPGLW